MINSKMHASFQRLAMFKVSLKEGKKENMPKRAFITRSGHYEFLVIHNALAALIDLMKKVLRGINISTKKGLREIKGIKTSVIL